MCIFRRIFNFKPLQHGLFRFGAPIYLQLIFSTCDSCIKDIVRDSFLSFIGDYDFYGVVFQALCLVDRNRICNLEWDNSRVVIFIVLISTSIFVNAK